MIRYHGGPCTPLDAAIELWTRRHALVSFARPEQTDLALRVAVSVVFDNGAFTSWRNGSEADWKKYSAWVSEYYRHPTFAWALIPDVIEGTEEENDDLLMWWGGLKCAPAGVPVWHMHESLPRLHKLVTTYPMVAIGSSGQYAEPGTMAWWGRMAEAMAAACDDEGRPHCKLHGLRQMDSTIFSHIPYTSVDSSRISRKIGLDEHVPRAYRHLPPKARALVLAWDADLHLSAARWTGTIATQKNLEISYAEQPA